jgi:hypothetical protein
MNEFRIFFQLFLIVVFFSGMYVIFWLDKYHETFTETTDSPMSNTLTDSPMSNTLDNSTNDETSSGNLNTIFTTIAPYLPPMTTPPFVDDQPKYFASPDGTIIITITNGANIVESPDGTLTTVTSPDNSITVTNDNNKITVLNTNNVNTNPNGSLSISDTNNTINIDIVTPVVSETNPEGYSRIHREGNTTITNGENGGSTITDKDGIITIIIVVSQTVDGVIEYPEGTIFNELPDGTKVYEYPNESAVVKKRPDGTIIAESPDGTIITKSPDGTIITQSSDGTIITQLLDGTIITEIRNPYGTVTTKITNPYGTIITETDNVDGTITTETKSPDGTITTETKSPDGTIITETKSSDVIVKIETRNPDGTIKIETRDPYGTITIETRNPDGTIEIQDIKPITKSYNISDLLTTLAPISAIVNNAVTDYKFPTTFAGTPENGSQKLDDYILNNHPVDVKTQPSINNDGEFLPATMAYPNSEYSPFDPLNQDISNYEYIGKEYVSSQPDGLSDNPMDPNWGGVMYTQNMIKSGKYIENNVNKPLLFQPKGIFIDNIPSSFGKPKDIY